MATAAKMEPTAWTHISRSPRASARLRRVPLSHRPPAWWTSRLPDTYSFDGHCLMPSLETRLLSDVTAKPDHGPESSALLCVWRRLPSPGPWVRIVSREGKAQGLEGLWDRGPGGNTRQPTWPCAVTWGDEGLRQSKRQPAFPIDLSSSKSFRMGNRSVFLTGVTPISFF